MSLDKDPLDNYSSNGCNSFGTAREMVARAEFGFSGVGRKCHVCDGEVGLCNSGRDEGVILDCGEGVRTCVLAKSGIKKIL